MTAGWWVAWGVGIFALASISGWWARGWWDGRQAEIEAEVNAEGCTDWDADWCPIHGHCTCTPDLLDAIRGGYPFKVDEVSSCKIHALWSEHPIVTSDLPSPEPSPWARQTLRGARPPAR